MRNGMRGAIMSYMDVTISEKDIAIDWDWVRNELAKKEHLSSFDKKASSETIRACVDDCLARARSLAQPRIISTRLRIVSARQKTVRLEKGITFTGKRLVALLNGAQFVRLFLITIGDGIEHLATSLMHRGEHLDGYILDRIGSLAVEASTEATENTFRRKYESKGKSVSMRVSSGYCDWPVEEQSEVARALDFSRIGVSLTRTCMMVPKKSISGLVAIAPKGRFTGRASPCSVCDLKECSFRR